MRDRRTTELSFETSNWSCPLRCQQCEHVRASGARCRNQVCFGTPLCWIHNSMVFGVKSKVSTIPNSGRGLFTTRDFPKDTWICPYIGEQTTMICVRQRYTGNMTAPYTEKSGGSGNGAVDCACSRGIGSLANGIFRANGAVASLGRHNCVSRYRPVGDGIPGMWLKSTKKINKGSEIFFWYGDGGYLLQDNHSTRRRAKTADSRPC